VSTRGRRMDPELRHRTFPQPNSSFSVMPNLDPAHEKWTIVACALHRRTVR
jgi:hypothetical protein